MFLSKRGLRIERVARRCLDKLLTNPERIVIGLDYRLLDLLARLSPRLASRAINIWDVSERHIGIGVIIDAKNERADGTEHWSPYQDRMCWEPRNVLVTLSHRMLRQGIMSFHPTL